MFVTFVTVGMAITSLVHRREDFVKIVNWCKKVIETDSPRFAGTRKICIRLVKVNIIVCYYLGFSATIFPAVTGLILAPGEFNPPMPFMLPFLNPKTWTAFLLNTLLQTSACFVWDTMGGVMFSFFGIHFYATYAYIDDLCEKIQALGRGIFEKDREKQEMVQPSRVKQYKRNQNGKNGNSSTSNKDFAESIKEIVEKYYEAVE